MRENERPFAEPGAVVGLLDADAVLDMEAPAHQFAHAGGVAPTAPAQWPPGGSPHGCVRGQPDVLHPHACGWQEEARGPPPEYAPSGADDDPGGRRHAAGRTPLA
eukprot:15436004-Alexandrium_andersonii.AAC.1